MYDDTKNSIIKVLIINAFSASVLQNAAIIPDARRLFLLQFMNIIILIDFRKGPHDQ